METINSLGIVGILVAVTLLISVYSSVISVNQNLEGNPEMSNSFDIVSKIYLSLGGLGIIIFLFLIFIYLLIGKKFSNLWVSASMISYAIITTFVILSTMLFVISVEAGMLSYTFFSQIQGSYLLLPILLIIVFLVLTWLLYMVVTNIKNIGKE
jgi:hypothetical protein